MARWLWLLCGLSACSGRGCERAPADRPPLVLGTIQEPDTVDPAFAQLASAQEVMRLLFRDLTELDDQWRIVPALAERLPTVRTSSAGETVRWTLRSGLRWSDGHPLSTEDLRFGWALERRTDLLTISHPVAIQVASMRALSPTTLEVRWAEPYADFEAPRVHAILPAHAYPRIEPGPGFRGFGREGVVGSGPYRLVEWIPGRSLTVESNPHWTGTQPQIPRIRFRFYASEDALEAGLITGDVDGTVSGSGLSLERAEALAARLPPERVLALTPSGAWLHLEARMDDPVAGQRSIRQAIDRAIDRRVLLRLVYGGHGVPAQGLFPPRHPAHRRRPELPPDLEAARALVAGAHLPKDAVLKLQYGAGNPGAERAAAYLEAQLRAIGIPLQLDPLPGKVLVERLQARTQAGLVLYNWRARPEWDGRSLLHSTGRQNAMGFHSEAVDQALDRARQTLEPDAWAAAVAEAEAAALVDLPVIPLVFRDEVSVRPRGLLGFKPTGAGPTTWNAETWTLEAPVAP